jgi:predicted ester cyclase
MSADPASGKRRLYEALNAHVRTPAKLAGPFDPGLRWRGQAPVDALSGFDAAVAGALEPLVAAFRDIERRDDIFLAGEYAGRSWTGAPIEAALPGTWVAATGHYCGTFTASLFGIPPTGALAWLRYGEFYHLGPTGAVVEAVTLWDLVDLMRQAGCNPLPPSPGVDILVPGPRTRDGVQLDTVDPAGGAITHALVGAMGLGLGEYDGVSLESMRQERFWSPDMLWYGPCGIGSNRRLKGFQDFHQRPFLVAFPDRRGGNHYGRIADGDYCASGGWPSVRATHAGPYLGCPASNRPITMRVMDFWRREGDLLAENWVFIDLPDLFQQFGVDLFAKMREKAAAR